MMSPHSTGVGVEIRGRVAATAGPARGGAGARTVGAIGRTRGHGRPAPAAAPAAARCGEMVMG